MKKIWNSFTKKDKEVSPFIKCSECYMSQKDYPNAPFYYYIKDTSLIVCESCFENAFAQWNRIPTTKENQ